jgi:hypothetical protein
LNDSSINAYELAAKEFRIRLSNWVLIPRAVEFRVHYCDGFSPQRLPIERLLIALGATRAFISASSCLTITAFRPPCRHRSARSR